MNKPKTVRVRIVVVMTDDGEWEATGSDRLDMSRGEQLCKDWLDYSSSSRHRTTFVEADVPLPDEPETVEGEVVP